MKFTEKRIRRTRCLIISLIVICITPLCERGRLLSGASSNEDYFAGKHLVCAIDLGDDMLGAHGLETGFSYELLNRFAQENNCNITVVNAGKKTVNYVDSLRSGSLDILVMHYDDTIASTDLNLSYKVNGCSAWAVGGNDLNALRHINGWLMHFCTTEEYSALKSQYFHAFNPIRRAEKGIITRTVSPYDDLFRKYASQLGWDWRMLAAVVYQESKFSINSVSHRGAKGLMQVMPKTGRYYGVEDLIDPDQNLKAGTSHLKRLQNIYARTGMNKDEVIKFTLAAYNAGEGRIADCRNFAAAKGLSGMSWDEVVAVIPQMREDSILEEKSVKLGKFKGHETIAYVDKVMSLYDSICAIHPSI